MSDATVALFIPPVLIALSGIAVLLITRYQDQRSAAIEAERRARASD